ncbi:MAG: hypothetical protein WCA48_11190 [Pseudomonas gingeri]|jgi:hypothetical protein
MTFNVVIAREVSEFFGEAVLEGHIELSGSIERFYAPVSYWTREQYIESWKRSFAEGYGSKTHSALIVSMHDPLQTNFLFVWVLYFGASKVFVQNKVLFLDDIDGTFEEGKINEYVDGRATVNEDGAKISEWEVELDDVLSFFGETC